MRSALRAVGWRPFPVSHVSRCLSSGQEVLSRAASPGVPQAWWLRLAQVRSLPIRGTPPAAGAWGPSAGGRQGARGQLCASAAGTAALSAAGAESSPFRGWAGTGRHQLSQTRQPPAAPKASPPARRARAQLTPAVRVHVQRAALPVSSGPPPACPRPWGVFSAVLAPDRKSTRLNSSHT